MKRFLKTDGWNIIEEEFHIKNQRASESIFSIGNGRIGQRGNFEETYTGDTLQGSYIAGIYFRIVRVLDGGKTDIHVIFRVCQMLPIGVALTLDL